MLFDLRAPGRKRTIQVIYGFLAVLLVGGIFVGVGTGLPSFLDNQGGGEELQKQLEKRRDTAEKALTANPKNVSALASLTSVRYDLAISRTGEDATALSEDSKRGLKDAASTWARYLALKPDPVNVDVARKMATAFSPGYLGQVNERADAQAIVTQAAVDKAKADGRRPPMASLLQLLDAQVAAKRKRQADITADAAVAAAPTGQRKAVEQAVKDLKSGKTAAAPAASAAPEKPQTIELGD